jgi:fluoroquinolone transport system permease protein
MIKRIIANSFKADIKFIARDPMLLLASIAPIMLILVLKLAFPLLSDFILLKTGFLLDTYYTIVAITMIAVIPMLFGMVYAFILLDENDLHIIQFISVTPAGKKNFLYMRMIVPALLSFITVLLSIVITNPVPNEGWLRTIFVSVLLTIQVPFVFLFIGTLARNKIEGLALSKLYGIFLIAVPLGLLLHHPWNYLLFFSPLYWISWSWVTSIPSESLVFGLVSVLITVVCVILFFRYFLKKHSG